MPRKALLIGVGKYDHYPSLSTTVAQDLDRIETALNNGGVRDVTRLGGGASDVTVSRLRAAIAGFIEKAPDGADLLVYYTGHGHCADGVTYLVPSDAVTELLGKRNYLVEAAFDDEVAVSKARSVSFVIDACRTALNGHSPGGGKQAPTPDADGSGRGRTTIIYACAPGEQAAALPADGASMFTEAFAELVEAAGQGIPVGELKRRLQDRTEERGRLAGLSEVPRIEVWPGTELESEPFAFFRPGRSTPPGQRWSGLLSGYAAMLGFSGPVLDNFAKICGRLDEIEATAPSIDDPLLRALPDQTLPERLARASVLMLTRGQDRDDGKPLLPEVDRLLIIAVTAALETAARTAEVTAAKRTAQRWRQSPGEREQAALTRLAVLAPQFARVYPTLQAGQQRLLEAWCDRVLSLREAIGKPGTLHGAIARLLPDVYGADPADGVGDLARYLIDQLHEQFIGRESDSSGGGATRRGPVEILAPATGDDTGVMLDGRRAAALVRLIWLLSADTRLLAPELGLSLIEGGTSPSEALHPLGRLTWIRAGSQVVDLQLRTTSAALDQALRQIAGDITAFLLVTTQPGGPLHELDLPRAATATRLLAASREGTPVFRLPHIRFEASAAETTELLMGTNLYGDAHVAIRELYQNAVDACTYRQWRITNASRGQRAPGGWRPDWVPRIIFRTGRDERGAWVECQDNGVGMSEYELRESFAKIGKRFRDLPEFLEETEQWGDRDDAPFRPISQFGIGVLSYFMIANEVVLHTTRSDDRHSRFSDPVLVRISDATGIFRFETPKGPPSDGTTVQLYLREEFADLDLAKALRQVIAAPVVSTVLASNASGQDEDQWEAGRLYGTDGKEIPASAAKHLGVYFHTGTGRVLVNGIPLNALGGSTTASPALRGLTISLDARSRPRLSVDRSRLLSVDLTTVRELLTSAADVATNWPDASIPWLLDLFRSDPETGTAVYRAFAATGKDLLLPAKSSLMPSDVFPQDRGLTPRPSSPGEDDIVPSPTMPTSRIGISVFDQEMANKPKERVSRGKTRLVRSDRDRFSPALIQLAQERRKIIWGKATGAESLGFPAFDDRLIRLLIMPRLGMLAKTQGSPRKDIEYQDLKNGAYGIYAQYIRKEAHFLLPQTYGSVADIAAQSENTIASGAIFAWAVSFLTRPARIALPRLISGIQNRHERVPEWTYGGPFGRTPLYSEVAPKTAFELSKILSFLALEGNYDEILSSIFLDATSRYILDAYSALSVEAKKVVQLLLQSDIDWSGLKTSTALDAKNFMTRFSEIFPEDAPDPTRPPKENPAIDARELEPLSDIARQAASYDLDGMSPYYGKDEQIPAIQIAATAAETDGYVTPDQICQELTQAGYVVASPDDWEPLATAARAFLTIKSNIGSSRTDGRFDIASNLDELLDATQGVEAEQVVQVAALLDEAGFATDSTKRIAQLGRLRRSDLWDLVEILGDNFPVTADVINLVRLAELRSIPLGEALTILTWYRPLIDPNLNRSGVLRSGY